MRRMPAGQWLPFEGYDTVHTCGTAPPIHPPPTYQGHPTATTGSGTGPASGFNALEFLDFTMPGESDRQSVKSTTPTAADRKDKHTSAGVTRGPYEGGSSQRASSTNHVATSQTTPLPRPVTPASHNAKRNAAFVVLVLVLLAASALLILSQRAQKPAASTNSAADQPETSALTTTSPDQPKSLTAVEYYEKGLALTRARKYEEAVEVYRLAVTQDPKLAAAYHEMGFAFLKLGKYKDSIEVLKQAATLKPDNVDTYMQLGQAYKAAANWEDAAGAFEKAIELKLENASAHYQLGQIYEKLDDTGAALNAYREAVRVKPDYAFAHYALGLLHLKLEDPDAAMAEYEILAVLNKKLADELYKRINQ